MHVFVHLNIIEVRNQAFFICFVFICLSFYPRLSSALPSALASPAGGPPVHLVSHPSLSPAPLFLWGNASHPPPLAFSHTVRTGWHLGGIKGESSDTQGLWEEERAPRTDLYRCLINAAPLLVPSLMMLLQGTWKCSRLIWPFFIIQSKNLGGRKMIWFIQTRHTHTHTHTPLRAEVRQQL